MSSKAMHVKEATASYLPRAEAQNVPPGYKRTDVGVIPEDWVVKLLPDVCRFRSGKAHEQYVVDFGQYICVNSKFISTDGSVRKYCSENFCSAQKGDVLMVMSDLPNGRALAKAYLVKANNLYAVNQRVCALTAYRDCAEYLFYVLNRNPYFLKFDDGVSQTHLLNHVFQKCPLPLPPNVAEQRAIAEAMSDVNSLLGALDALIAKKRTIKLATMQQLLTGKTRLPGYIDEWEIKSLGDVAEIKSGATPSTEVAGYWNGAIPWCTPTDITGTTGKYISLTERNITKAGLLSCAASLLPIGSLLLCSRATIGEVKIALTEISTNQGFKSLVCREGVSNEFLYYLILTLKTQMIERAIGSIFLEIGKRDLTSILIKMPKEKEQIEIATILSDMDAEISALETRREKTRALKQGMQQQLLTGRLRLLKPKQQEAEAC